MVFLLQKPSGTTADGIDYFTPAKMRPLSVASEDSRIIPSAVRMWIELAIAPGISDSQ